MNIKIEVSKMKIKMKLNRILAVAFILGMIQINYAQEPIRIGTTAASFLEYGYTAAGNSLGDAYVSMEDGLSSLYWNPAGIVSLKNTELLFTFQPWLADINSSYAAVGISFRGIGQLALSVTSVDYGDMPVTTMEMQEGTGELFSVNDMAVGLSYARSITNWFAFGGTAKFITSKIWHTQANAIATDLGVLIKTHFFSPTDSRAHGLKIGMSISNYGTRMQYDGIDLINPIDILPDEQGNFRDVPGQFRLSKWELPLIFRVGISLTPVHTENHQITLAVDALHPNNNAESMNMGVQYSWTALGLGRISFRGGYKALFMPESQYGLSMGVGIETFLLYNTNLKLDYAYRDFGVLGNVNSFSIGFSL